MSMMLGRKLRPWGLFRSLAVVGALLGGLSQARADLVTGINTGVDSLGNPLAAGAIDPHYQLVTSADSNAPGPNAYVVQDGQFPIGPWYANGASQWIAPYADGTTATDGLYVYRTTFDLTGYDVSSAQISGEWATDNNGLDIVINGNSTGNTTGATSFTGPTAFLITQGFVSGLNILEFKVNNEFQATGNPTGLRVEGVVTANSAVPEPASLAMLATGGLIAGCAARRRKVRAEADAV